MAAAEITAGLHGASELIDQPMGEHGRLAPTGLGHAVMPLNVAVMPGFPAGVLEGRTSQAPCLPLGSGVMCGAVAAA